MADIISGPSGGNWTGASTWCPVETGINAKQLVRTGSTASTTSFVYSPVFTMTSLDVIDGIMLFVGQNSANTGTFSVELNDGVGGVLKTVTVNVTDLPLSTVGGWVFFKFGSSYTSLGLTTYQIGVKSSVTGEVLIFRSATTADWAKVLRLTSNVNVASGDNTFVTGEWTAAGASNSIIVTQDNTAATSWGKIDICSKGTLNWSTSAATAYYLKTAGILEIWDRGVMQMGTAGTPIPTGSTNELEFVNASNVDRGLEVRYGGTLTTYGYAKTLKAKLLGVSKTITNKAVAAGVATLTTSAVHGLSTNDLIEVLMTTADVDLDGTFVITSVPTTTTFTYATTSSNVSSIAVGGTVYKSLKVGATDGTLDVTPTGWKTSDNIVLAATGQTAGEVERVALAGDVSSSAFTFGATSFKHVAAAPYQAEVINLTQNIKIHGTSTSLQAYVNVSNGGIINCFYTEFYFMGAATASKRGIDYQQITNTGVSTSSLNYCSMRDFSVTSSISVNISASSVYFTVDNCVIHATNTNTSAALNILSATANITITNNVILLKTANIGLACTTVGIVQNIIITGNTIAGAAGNSMSLSGAITTFNNNVIHSSASNGLVISGTGHLNWTISNCSFWRMLTGIIINIAGNLYSGITFDTVNMYGNTTNMTLNTNTIVLECIFKSCIFNSGPAGYTSSIGLQINGDVFSTIFTDCVFGSPYQQSFDINIGPVYILNTYLNNCIFNSPTTIVNNASLLGNKSALGFMKYNQVAGEHRAYKQFGIIKTDSVIYDVSPSERLTPNSASNKLESASKFITMTSGASRTVSCKVRESVIGDGIDYTGARARLVGKYNPAIGMDADVVIATGTIASEGAFETISGSTPTPNADGQLELVVQVDGTSGWVNVDTWTVT